MARSPRTPYLGCYLRNLVLSTIGLTVAALLLARLEILAVPSGGLVLLPPAIAAYMAGRAWGRAEGVVPAGRAAWHWAVVAGLGYLAVQMVLLPLGFIAFSFERSMLLPVALVLCALFLATIVIHRVCVVWGARSGADI